MDWENEYKIDSRTVEDLRKEIGVLASSYTPEWDFNEKNPDSGSVIGLIFANQMGENIKKINLVMEKYRTEFVNMLNLSLRPAYPANGAIVIELIQGTIEGIDVPKGTKFLGTNPGEETQLVFESTSDIHVTNSRLTDILSLSGVFGKIDPILGTDARQLKVPDVYFQHDSGIEPESTEFSSFPLFDYQSGGIQRNALLLFHESLFHITSDVDLSIKVSGVNGEDLADTLSDPQLYAWSYYTEEGFLPFESVKAEKGAVVLQKSSLNPEAPLLQDEDTAYSMICVEALQPVTENMEVSSLLISSKCEKSRPEFIYNDVEDLEAEEFLPFGEIVSVFDECYIGGDYIFSQQDAFVQMKFQLSANKKLVTFTAAQEREELKIIKRKPRAVQYETAETSPQRVVFEYYNGIGWRKLACTQDWSTLFDGSHSGDICIEFYCPSDWKPFTTGGYTGRMLRMRVVQADNCYLQPCIHTMPVLKDFSLSYTYFNCWKQPQKLRKLCGTSFFDLTPGMLRGEPFEAFSALPYQGNALYLGFDQKISGAPVSILFEVQESIHFAGAPLAFEYSTLNGFEQLKVIDHTENMSETGTVKFVLPSDFAKKEIEGRSRYWIRLVDERGIFNNPDQYHPVIKNIFLNAVEIKNVVTMPEEVFYIDAAMPNMEFQLAGQNILSADVFVNEKGSLSLPAMRAMLEEQPENVRVEYDHLGNISEFFVRWKEVDNFDSSKPKDRHYLIDRMDSTLHFGDGISVMIPSARKAPAITVQVSCCNGEAANLPAGAITEPFSRLLYVSDIYNPIATYAGGDIESVENAQIRGANLVNTKNRLVSELDFVREIKAYSSSIDKVKCIMNQNINGEAEKGLVNVAIMMKDYENGAYSFSNLKERLHQYLLAKCEATLTKIYLNEPVYVEISVCVWAETNNMDQSFEIQDSLKTCIRNFLDPNTGGNGSGWQIGTLPDATQIYRMLHSSQYGTAVAYYAATARYIDKNGVHERALDEMKPGPFMIGVNGNHTVHMRFVR